MSIWSEIEATSGDAILPDSYFVFGIHKCGSSLMHKMVRGVCEQAGIPFLDVPGTAGKEGMSGGEWARDPDLVPLFTRHRVFLGFRFFPAVLLEPELRIREKRFVLLVRDPRDALVSQYFSFGGKHRSHALPPKGAEKRLANIQRTAHMEIDEYVLFVARKHLKKMVEYREHLDFGLGMVRRYEDVFFDKLSFLREIFEHFGLAVDDAVLVDVAGKHDIRPSIEDPTKHIRKGTPGDYAEKLKQETIVELNKIFGEVASAFGYDLKN